MSLWFKKKEPQITSFPDNDSAFEHACKHQENKVLIDAILPALVEEEGKRGEEGEHWFKMRLANSEEESTVWGCTLKDAPGIPAVGDLVGFRIVRIANELPPGMNIIGYIACRLAPEHVSGKGWRVADNFTPKNLKPVLHL